MCLNTGASKKSPLLENSKLIGASLSEPHTYNYEFAVCPPTLPVWIYYIYCIYIYRGENHIIIAMLNTYKSKFNSDLMCA